MLSLPTALLAACLAQEPGPTPAAPAPPALRTVNRVELVVNDRVITRTELNRAYRRLQQVRPVSTPQEEQQAKAEIVQSRVQSLLLVQAGEDLGRDEQEVERIVDNYWESKIDEAGGAREYSESMAGEEGSLQRREKLTEEIYTFSYTRVITGVDPGPQGRPYVDRFVRPGVLRRTYDRMVREGIGLEQVFGLDAQGKPIEDASGNPVARDRTLVVQSIVIGARSQEELERGRSLIEELRGRALAGEDFNALVEAYGQLTGDRAITTGVRPQQLGLLGPEHGNWALDAAEGDISGVLPVLTPEDLGIIGWRVLRVLEVVPALAPPFDDLATQRALTEWMVGRRDNRLQGEALQELLETAYVHPDPEKARAAVEERLRKASER